ncbi:MAG: alanine--tRNA ligase, partial [Eubacterium sp.]|nr:alanine--tRNA ligase [Eubacterium sp.]
YPELKDKEELITKVIKAEEESFGKTIDAGLVLLDEYIKNTVGTVFSGEDAFKLNDTYGFPLDLTKDILEEHGLTVDEEKFNSLLENQKRTARNARADAGADAWKGTSVKIEAQATEFLGYTDFECEAKVLALIGSDGQLVDMLGAGEEGVVVLDRTTFYAESGGQVGDSGVIANGENNVFIVGNTTKNDDKIYIHSGSVSKGVISVGDKVACSIDEIRRKNIMRNHTAAHLLQAALREVLGTHVEQAGQLVNEHEVRFDFTHFDAMTEEELNKTELLVNQFIMSATPVSMLEMPIDEAKKMGAMMLFGEKYGDIVRVVKAGDFSTEFCGGTHVSNSGELGLFKIVSEASVASGVRRITAVTGTNLMLMLNLFEKRVKGIASVVKSSEKDVVERVEALSAENRSYEKKIAELNAEIARLKSADLFAKPDEVEGLDVYVALIENTTPDALRKMGDSLKDKGDNTVAVIAGVNEDKTKANLVAVCGKGAIAKGVKAGDLVREIAKLAGGGGGGRPDSAMAGAKDVSKLNDALAAVKDKIRELIK